MSLNLLICDDSGFARKQMAKSLPPDWNVDIHFGIRVQQIGGLDLRESDT